MKKLIYFTVALLSLVMGLSGPPAMAAKGGNEKVGMCHITKDATNPYVYISISTNAVTAHLSHSDGLGHEDFVADHGPFDCILDPEPLPENKEDCEAAGYTWEPVDPPIPGFPDAGVCSPE